MRGAAMKKQRYGLVVCIGSGSSMLPSDPFYSAYAASKAAVETFCESLRVGEKSEFCLFSVASTSVKPDDETMHECSRA